MSNRGSVDGITGSMGSREGAAARALAWIQTFSGRRVCPFNPAVEDLAIEDIAHALSLICRYGGHVRRFYSVAQHSVLVSRLVAPEHAAWGLLHDASEAYLADVVTPVKRFMANYQETETGLMRAVAARFGLGWPQPHEVTWIDRGMLRVERRDLMGPARLDMRIEPWDPARAEEEFLERFGELLGRPANEA